MKFACDLDRFFQCNFAATMCWSKTIGKTHLRITKVVGIFVLAMLPFAQLWASKEELTKDSLEQFVKARTQIGADAMAVSQVVADQLWAYEEHPSEDSIDEIVVTGSRIGGAELADATAVSQVHAEESDYQGTVRVEDLMRTLPQVWSMQNTGHSYGATGTATINLRNLGSLRTLVLVNGRRMPAGSPVGGGTAGINAGADLNQIPSALISRVDVLTGGASAIYGSDAMAGVVNFILDTEFEGFSVEVQTSIYSHANSDNDIQGIVKRSNYDVASDRTFDGRISDIAVLLGSSIADDGGHIMGYLTYRDISEVTQSSRDFSSCSLNNLITDCQGSSTIPEGRFSNFLNANDVGFDYIVEGTEFIPRDGRLYNYGPLNYFQRPDERIGLGMFAEYPLVSDVEFYGEVMYNDDRTVAQIAPSGAFFITSVLNCSNPFLSDSQYEMLTQARLSPNQQNALDSKLLTMSEEQRIDFLDAAFCQNRMEDSIQMYIGRRNVEGGPRRHDLQHRSLRVVSGLRGSLSDSWDYDVNYQHAKVNLENTYQNDLSVTRVKRALDAVRDDNGDILCNSALQGLDLDCVPWNIFSTGGVTQDAIDYMTLPLVARGTTTSKVFSAFMYGTLGATLPFEVAIGTELREVGLTFSPDGNFQTGEGAGQGGATLPVEGSYDVVEFVMESNLPVPIAQGPIRGLNVNAAFRHSAYSTGHDASTFGLRGLIQLQDVASVRTSVQRALRVASIRELYTPQGFNQFDMPADPCGGPVTSSSSGILQTASGYTLEQCQRSGVTEEQFGTIQHSPAAQYNYLQGGNPDVAPEESTTYSVGIVVEPKITPLKRASVDWYSIEVTDGIANLSPTFILEQCLNGELDMCEFVKRNPQRGDLWIGPVDQSGHIVALQNNLSVEKVSGFDIEVVMELEVQAFGTFRLHSRSSFVNSWERRETSAAPEGTCAGYWGGICGYPTPKFQNSLRATWVSPLSGLELTSLWRFIGSSDAKALNTRDIEAVNYIDLGMTYEIAKSHRVVVGLANAFDVAPPVVGSAAAPTLGGNGNVFPGIYDIMGQYIFARVQFNY